MLFDGCRHHPLKTIASCNRWVLQTTKIYGLLFAMGRPNGRRMTSV